jgi:hypothetical protein
MRSGLGQTGFNPHHFQQHWWPRASVHSHGVPSGDAGLHDAAREADAQGGDAKTLAAGCGPTQFADVLIFSAAMGAVQWQTSRMMHSVRFRRNPMT